MKSKLDRLIEKNPDLSVVVMTDGWVEDVTDFKKYEKNDCFVGEYLDTTVPWGADQYTDREEFEQHLTEYLCCSENTASLSDKEFEQAIERESCKYESYWQKAIIITENILPAREQIKKNSDIER